jgi:hypothetical protein
MENSVYEHLAGLDRSFREILALLERLEEHPCLRKRQLRGLQVQVKELRALVCQDVVEALNDFEQQNAGRLYRKRRQWEKRLKGPEGAKDS